MRHLRGFFLPAGLLLLLGLLGAAMFAQSPTLAVERRGELLRIASPQLRLLSGRALDRLRDGVTVNYVLALRATSGQERKPLFESRERFAVSFDLWEEKYSVTQLRAGGRSASRLTAAMAEEWLLDAMPIPVKALPGDRPFAIRLECLIDKASGADKAGDGEKGAPNLSLAGLIDIFSRRESEGPQKWEAATGLLRLGDLKDNDAGSRNVP